MSATFAPCDKPLLDYAYGELPPSEAAALERHLASCAPCRAELAEMGMVRRTMAGLGQEPAPEAGLDSLLAYAEQAARRAAEGPAPARTAWRRWLAPLLGASAVAVLALVTLPVARQAAVPLPSQVSAGAAVRAAEGGGAAAASAPVKQERALSGEAAVLPAPRTAKSMASGGGGGRAELYGLEAAGVRAALPNGATGGGVPAGNVESPGDTPAAAPARKGAVLQPPPPPLTGLGNFIGGDGSGGRGGPVGAAETQHAAVAAPAEAKEVRSLRKADAWVEARAEEPLRGGGMGTGAVGLEGRARDMASAESGDLGLKEEEEQALPRLMAQARPAGEADAAEEAAPRVREAKKKAALDTLEGGALRGAPAPAAAPAMDVARGAAPVKAVTRLERLRRAVVEAKDAGERRKALQALCGEERAEGVHPAEGCERLEREFPDGGTPSR